MRHCLKCKHKLHHSIQDPNMYFSRPSFIILNWVPHTFLIFQIYLMRLIFTKSCFSKKKKRIKLYFCRLNCVCNQHEQILRRIRPLHCFSGDFWGMFDECHQLFKICLFHHYSHEDIVLFLRINFKNIVKNLLLMSLSANLIKTWLYWLYFFHLFPQSFRFTLAKLLCLKDYLYLKLVIIF